MERRVSSPTAPLKRSFLGKPMESPFVLAGEPLLATLFLQVKIS